MPDLKILNVDGKFNTEVTARFIYYFKMNPPDCNQYQFTRAYRGSFAEAMVLFWKDLTTEYKAELIKDLHISIDIVPTETTIINY